ncbi:FkbM family methyltransferase [Novosphingobium aquiterrae]|uniref:FkbM family methyltransferase n=1 Tax=Novosphingobium aquiterrae TaxID=624388 RepID=A0ABV6PHW2_9SPHN
MSVMDAVRRVLRPYYKAAFPASWAVRSYSQEGEDILIGPLLEHIQAGFYVDVGCHHPYRFSNTYRLYRRGWSGLCIDPLPGVTEAFARARPRDVVVAAGISQEPGELEYVMFNEPALNTFDPALAEAQSARPAYHVIQRKKVATLPLRDVLARHGVGQIDFMTVDVEGLDLQVLASNDWQRWRPRLVLAESLSARLDTIFDDPLYRFMVVQGYAGVQKIGRNILFLLDEA